MTPGDDSTGELDEPVADSVAAGPDVSKMSKADALRTAYGALGRQDVPAARRWLLERGVTVDRRYAYTVQPGPVRNLRVLAGGES